MSQSLFHYKAKTSHLQKGMIVYQCHESKHIGHGVMISIKATKTHSSAQIIRTRWLKRMGILNTLLPISNLMIYSKAN